MLPYNVCENKWLSKSRKHLKDNSNLYIGVSLLLAISLFTLAIIVSFSSFF